MKATPLYFLGTLAYAAVFTAPAWCEDLQIEPIPSSESTAAPQLAGADTRLLTFDEAITQILARSTSIAIQEAGFGATSERSRPASLVYVPTLTADAKTTSYRVVGNDPTFNSQQAELVSNLNLFRTGADFAALQAARADVATQRTLVEDTVLRTEYSAVTALVAQIQLRKEIEVSANIVKMQTDLKTIAEKRYSGGYLSLQESEKVAVDLANANSQLADTQIRSYTANTNLENLLGHTRVTPEWPWRDRLSAVNPSVIPRAQRDQDLVQILSRRPDWRAAEARVEAEDQRLKRGWRLLGPSLDGSLAYGYYTGYSNSINGAQWTGSLTLSLPIFDQLVNYSNARAQAYVKGAAETAFEQTRRDAKADWDSARQSFETSLSSALSRDKTLVTSRSLYQDNLKRFKSGRINANDLVLDQTRLYNSELFAVQGWAQVHLAYARLCRSQGLRLKDCRY